MGSATSAPGPLSSPSTSERLSKTLFQISRALGFLPPCSLTPGTHCTCEKSLAWFRAGGQFCFRTFGTFPMEAAIHQCSAKRAQMAGGERRSALEVVELEETMKRVAP
jgi:hypothetical protein